MLGELHRLRSEFVRGVAAERYRLAPTSITVPPWGEAARSATDVDRLVTLKAKKTPDRDREPVWV
jgi:hypothetical protein